MNRLIVLISAVCLLALAVPAPGQVMRSQGGREIDANIRVGSDGFNSVRTADPSGWLSTQLYVTGQATGGFSFRHVDAAPYAAGNQLRLALPTEMVETFSRDSVGLDRVLMGPTYSPQPYFGRTGTVLGTSDIARGLNVPGSTIPRTPVSSVPTLGTPIYVTPSANYMPVVPEAMSGVMRIEPVIREATTLAPSPVAGLMPERLRVSPLFGVAHTAAGERLDLEIARRYLPPGAHQEPQPGQMVQPGEPQPPEQQVQPGLPDEVRQVVTPGQPGQAVETAPRGPRAPQLPARPDPLVPGGPVPGEPLIAPEEFAEPIPPGLADPMGTRRQVPQAGQDVFMDLSRELDALRDRRARSVRDPQLPPGAEMELEPLDPDNVYEAARRQSEQARQQIEITEEYVRLHGLAGRRPDTFNRYMNFAEQALHRGEFYDAAAHYETARVLDRSNPLPAVGASLAYLGAGEPVSAAYHLEVAMRLFPGLMEVQLDLPRLIGPDLLEQRITEIDQQLADPDLPAQPGLVFLGTYLNAQTGQADQARRHATRLRALAEEGSVLDSYARHVLESVR